MGGRVLAHVCLEDLQRLPLVVVCSWPSTHGEHGLVFARRLLGDVGRGRLVTISGPSPPALGRMGDESGRTGRVQVKKLFRSWGSMCSRGGSMTAIGARCSSATISGVESPLGAT